MDLVHYGPWGHDLVPQVADGANNQEGVLNMPKSNGKASSRPDPEASDAEKALFMELRELPDFQFPE